MPGQNHGQSRTRAGHLPLPAISPWEFCSRKHGKRKFRALPPSKAFSWQGYSPRRHPDVGTDSSRLPAHREAEREEQDRWPRHGEVCAEASKRHTPKGKNKEPKQQPALLRFHGDSRGIFGLRCLGSSLAHPQKAQAATEALQEVGHGLRSDAVATCKQSSAGLGVLTARLRAALLILRERLIPHGSAERGHPPGAHKMRPSQLESPAPPGQRKPPVVRRQGHEPEELQDTCWGGGRSGESSESWNPLPRSDRAPGALAAQPRRMPLLHLKGEALGTAGDSPQPHTTPRTGQCQSSSQRGVRRKANKPVTPKHLQQQEEAAPRQHAHLLLPRQPQACPTLALLASLPPTHGEESPIPAEPGELLHGMLSPPPVSLPAATPLRGWLQKRRVSTSAGVCVAQAASSGAQQKHVGPGVPPSWFGYPRTQSVSPGAG